MSDVRQYPAVNVERLGRLARTLRIRQRLTQASLARQAGVSRRAISMLEGGRARDLRLATVEMVLTALGARSDIRVFWHGPELDRMLDEGHSALGTAVKRRLNGWGWLVRIEVSFSHYGERGRIDLLAFHPPSGTLVLIELKSELVDVQSLLGSLDVKLRLAPGIAERFAWDVQRTVPAIVFIEDSATRKRLARVETLFDRFPRRGRAALTWLRGPSDPAPPGLLWLTSVGALAPRRPRQRVRASTRGRAA